MPGQGDDEYFAMHVDAIDGAADGLLRDTSRAELAGQHRDPVRIADGGVNRDLRQFAGMRVGAVCPDDVAGLSRPGCKTLASGVALRRLLRAKHR